MINELEIKDNQGNIVIQPGLKVRHKDSQFEYTVEDVVEDPEGEILVILRMPEDPRFEPPPEEEIVISDGPTSVTSLQETNPDNFYFEPEDTTKSVDEDEDFLAVPQKEFEKEYEVR
jgi:hypothetical protein